MGWGERVAMVDTTVFPVPPIERVSSSNAVGPAARPSTIGDCPSTATRPRLICRCTTGQRNCYVRGSSRASGPAGKRVRRSSLCLLLGRNLGRGNSAPNNPSPPPSAREPGAPGHLLARTRRPFAVGSRSGFSGIPGRFIRMRACCLRAFYPSRARSLACVCVSPYVDWGVV